VYELTWIDEGGVTSAAGFSAAATVAGIKTYGPEPRLDVALLLADRPCAVAGVLTQNRVCGAPVTVCRERLPRAKSRGVVVNSGCSNVATGEQGVRDAARMTELAGQAARIAGEDLLVASTGVIGRLLPMEKLEAAIPALGPTLASGALGSSTFARAIMTTDTVPKSRALRSSGEGGAFVLGGAAKGAGMVHPDMATVLCFLTTDAAVDASFLQSTLKAVADVSLNMLDVDMDTSTSDTMLIFASGVAGNAPIRAGHPAAERFAHALRALCVELTRDLARDGEGAKTLIEVDVEGAASNEDARAAARTIVSSPLVKTMVTGRDPNLGRVLAALGRSGALIDAQKTGVYIEGLCAFENGAPSSVPYAQLSAAMNKPEVRIRVTLGMGSFDARAFGCDLTEEYIRINADYTT
jgi:glutamate N-acetyltransferase/amino-acid N-acetyltransferase